MADIALTAAQVAVVDPFKAIIRSYIAAEAITKGDAVCFDTAGKVKKAGAATASGIAGFRGIALNTVGADDAVDVLHEGEVYGYTVSSLNCDTLAYLSNTSGKIATAAGSQSVAIGRIVALTDRPTYTKVVRVHVNWTT